jgi:hypothetical protein
MLGHHINSSLLPKCLQLNIGRSSGLGKVIYIKILLQLITRTDLFAYLIYDINKRKLRKAKKKLQMEK